MISVVFLFAVAGAVFCVAWPIWRRLMGHRLDSGDSAMYWCGVTVLMFLVPFLAYWGGL